MTSIAIFASWAVGGCVSAELLGYFLHRLLHSGAIGFLSRSHMRHHMVLYGPLKNNVQASTTMPRSAGFLSETLESSGCFRLPRSLRAFAVCYMLFTFDSHTCCFTWEQPCRGVF